LQFLLQHAGVMLLRFREPDRVRPFRMWLYPLPALVALAGFALVVADKFALVARGGVLAAAVVALFLLRARKRREWPFARDEYNSAR